MLKKSSDIEIGDMVVQSKKRMYKYNGVNITSIYDYTPYRDIARPEYQGIVLSVENETIRNEVVYSVLWLDKCNTVTKELETSLIKV